MAAWTKTELTKIAKAEELEISPRRRGGKAQDPVTIWVVRHGDDIYVRSVHGRTSGWFRGTQVRHEGHISAGGVDKDVTFVDGGKGINDDLDAAYRKKYGGYERSIVDTVVSPKARAATIKLVPR
jgi:hypothetical protein